MLCLPLLSEILFLGTCLATPFILPIPNNTIASDSCASAHRTFNDTTSISCVVPLEAQPRDTNSTILHSSFANAQFDSLTRVAVHQIQALQEESAFQTGDIFSVSIAFEMESRLPSMIARIREFRLMMYRDRTVATAYARIQTRKSLPTWTVAATSGALPHGRETFTEVDHLALLDIVNPYATALELGRLKGVAMLHTVSTLRPTKSFKGAPDQLYYEFPTSSRRLTMYLGRTDGNWYQDENLAHTMEKTSNGEWLAVAAG